MDYAFHMVVTSWNEGVLVKEKGINSFKIFMAYKGFLMVNDEVLLKGFKMCNNLGALAQVHAFRSSTIMGFLLAANGLLVLYVAINLFFPEFTFMRTCNDLSVGEMLDLINNTFYDVI
jgi:dihydroorotase-like cyclic amidohydrolase